MNDEAAESRGPSGPSHDEPAPSVPAENIAEAPAAAETAPPPGTEPAEPPTEVPTADPT